MTSNRERQEKSSESNENPASSEKGEKKVKFSSESEKSDASLNDSECSTDDRKTDRVPPSERRITWPADNRTIETLPRKDERTGKLPADDKKPGSSPPGKERTGESPDTDDERTGESSKDVDGEESGKRTRIPGSLVFILLSNLCERYSFFAIKTVLVLFCIDQLEMDNDAAAALFHIFFMLVFFFPIPGAILADSLMGNFNHILLLSLVYAIGCVVLTFGSVPAALSYMRAMSLAGLVTIAVGCGCIMPCVPAFGGNQIPGGQNLRKQRQDFFFHFYLMVNIGSICATVFSPMLRSHVGCFEETTCYPLAFGLPAALMILSVAIFAIGRPWYTLWPPQGNVMLKACKCASHALGRQMRRTGEEKPHWLDYADDKYDEELISDTKRILAILKLYLPLTVFWALFSQTGSRWTQQAKLMDGYVFDLFTIEPDQMQAANPILIILFIPIFQYIIYPISYKLRLFRKPLQRITLGGLLAALAFVCAGLLQLAIERTSVKLSPPGYSELIFINNSPCRLQAQQLNSTFEPFSHAMFKDLPDNTHSFQLVPEVCDARGPFTANVNLSSEVASYMVTLVNRNLVGFGNRENKSVTLEGRASAIEIYYNIDILDPTNASVKLVSRHKSYSIDLTPGTHYFGSYGVTEYWTITEGRYWIFLPENSATGSAKEPANVTRFDAKGKYILSIYVVGGSLARASVFELVPAGRICILYQLIQYAVLTAAEILLSVTGLDFSYSQAPPSAKSVIQAAWLTTLGVGNLSVAVISAIQLFSLLSWELFFYATVMAVAMVIFAILAYFYEYVDPREYEKRRKKLQTNSDTDDNPDRTT